MPPAIDSNPPHFRYLAASIGAALFLSTGTAQATAIFAPGTNADYVEEVEEDLHSEFNLIDPFVTQGNKWGDTGFGTPGGTVTYSYIDTGTDCTVLNQFTQGQGCSALDDFMPSGFRSMIDLAFDVWQAVANIQFVEVPDGGGAVNANDGDVADIRIGGTNIDDEFGVLAFAFFPPPNGNTVAGDIFFDSSENWALNPQDGFDILTVATHEVGHAIGLRHTNVPNQLMNAIYNSAINSPQSDDIAGAQFIYGPAVIPLPPGIALLSGGLLLAGALGWRRRKAPVA